MGMNRLRKRSGFNKYMHWGGGGVGHGKWVYTWLRMAWVGK